LIIPPALKTYVVQVVMYGIQSRAAREEVEKVVRGPVPKWGSKQTTHILHST
jgi:hypothetical protein